MIVSASFVHREQALWRRNPCHNQIWLFTSIFLLFIHTTIGLIYIYCYIENIGLLIDNWEILLFILFGPVISLLISEICKWQEIKYVRIIRKHIEINIKKLVSIH